MVELCTHLAIERARLVTSHLKLARPISIPTEHNNTVHFRNLAFFSGWRTLAGEPALIDSLALLLALAIVCQVAIIPSFVTPAAMTMPTSPRRVAL